MTYTNRCIKNTLLKPKVEGSKRMDPALMRFVVFQEELRVGWMEGWTDGASSQRQGPTRLVPSSHRPSPSVGSKLPPIGCLGTLPCRMETFQFLLVALSRRIFVHTENYGRPTCVFFKIILLNLQRSESAYFVCLKHNTTSSPDLRRRAAA